MTRPGQADRYAVLVVDGDELVRWSVAERLRECRYSVEVVANAAEALQRCPDRAVVLLDHDLPDVDGLALADRIGPRHPRCTIVLMTADATPDLRREARERGVLRVLEKPFSLEELLTTIHDASGHTTTSPAPSVLPDDPGHEGPWETGALPGV